ncbi:MAG: CCA tRNA nucleotidyltransferase [Eubacteriales bacterium]
MIQFPQTPQYLQGLSLIDQLNQQGFQAYLVGGCVRDLLLRKEVSDYDICSSALPEDVQRIFPKTVDTGSQWGTITVVTDHDSYEITTFRKESTYTDGRHPDAIDFHGSLESDLERRDFTINAMAYHRKTGLIDPYGGEVDLSMGILRAVGNPYLRFAEDYLRILRGLRFSATLNLKLEEETGEALLVNSHGLIDITRERVTNEIKKLVMGQYVENIADYYPVLEEGVFFGIDCLWEAEEEGQLRDKWKEISQAPPLLSLRLALFLSLFAPDSRFLKLSKQESQEVDFLCEMPCIPWEGEKFFLDTIQKEGKERTKLLLFYQKHQFPYHRGEIEALEATLMEKDCTSLGDLAINGTDLLQRGVQGEMIGKLLAIALKMVLAEEVNNEKEALLALIFGERQEQGELDL